MERAIRPQECYEDAAGMNEDQIDKASELLEIMLNNAVSAVEDLKKI